MPAERLAFPKQARVRLPNNATSGRREATPLVPVGAALDAFFAKLRGGRKFIVYMEELRPHCHKLRIDERLACRWDGGERGIFDKNQKLR